LATEVERSRQNVFNLALFNEVNIQSEIVSGLVYLIVEVKERWFIFPIPQLDLEERNTYDIFQNQNLHRLVYGLNLEWNNVTGRNERLNIYGQLGFSQRLYVDFVRPAIIPGPYIDLIVKARLIREPEILFGTQDAKAQWGETTGEPLRRTQSLRVALRKRFGDVRKSLTMEWGYARFQFADSIYAFNPTFVPTTDASIQYPSLVLTFANDQRDYKAFPLKGYKYQILFRQVGLGNWGDTRFTKIGASWAQHIPIRERWNIAYGTYSMFSLGDQIPFFEKNYIGYRTGEFATVSAGLRGYEPFTIGGSFLHMSKAELKFALFPLQQIHLKYMPIKQFQSFPIGVYLSTFTDWGYIRDETFGNEDQLLKNQILRGYGLGLNIIGFYDNLLRIELSRNHLGQTGIYLHGLVSIK